MTRFSDRYVKNLDPSILLELLSIAKQLREAIEKEDAEKLKSLESQKSFLLMLLEYLILNIDNPNIDKTLIQFLEWFLKIKIKKKKQELEEEEKEEELTHEEEERRRRIICYEVYKVLNPNRIAGETEIQNFVSNVKVRGIAYALKHEGSKLVNNFDRKDLEALESNKKNFVSFLAQQGFKGGGMGMK